MQVTSTMAKLPEQLYGKLSSIDGAGWPWLHYGERWERLAEVVKVWNAENFQAKPFSPNEAVLYYMNDSRTPKRSTND